MKKVILLLSIIVTFTMYSQNYNKNSIEFELGPTKIRDVTPVKKLNFNLGYRYMFNTKFGAKIDIGYTELEKTGISYYSSSLSGVLNIGRLLEFESFTKHYTIIAGLGGTYTYSDNHVQLLHRLSNFHLSGFINNEFKVSDNVFLHLGLNVITGVNSRPFSNISPDTRTTSIINFNAGIIVSLGKHKKHADWYLEKIKPIKDTIYMQPIVHDNSAIVNNTIEKYIVKNSNEYIFFKNNSFNVDIQGLNAIKKIVDNLKGKQTIVLKGYASPPASFEYNFKLSKKRCLSVKSKLISLGVDESIIKIEPNGEINTKDNKNIDLSRCVQLIIIDK